MKDRFKFRAKRLDNNKFYYGSYLYLHNAPEYNWNGTKNGKYKDVHYIIDETDVNIGIDPKTLCQCTGLKDKNGKLTYFDDFIKTPWGEIGILTAENKGENYGKVVLRSVTGKSNLSTFSVFDLISECEIIGNIFDNKDLLKEN